MKKLIHALLALAVMIPIWSCNTVPVTGRNQLSLIPNATMLSMSYDQYGQFIDQNKLSTNTTQTALVKNVGQKIQHSVEDYMAQNNLSHLLDGYAWEFNLIEEDVVNAWCMPGGKVVVYTGILPVTQNETGLAVVMGHEIAHAIADHGGERMSQALLQQLGGVALTVALHDEPEETQALWFAAYGAGSQLGVMLPFSRLHESEADHLGLIFMAMAGYDPNEAVNFWSRMSKMSGGQKPPEFLSTHPSDETRIAQIKEKLPEAMKYYNK